MNLRFVKPGLAALGLPVHPTLIDPRTKSPLVALGVTSRGPVWPAMGGSGEDDDEDDDDEGKEGGKGGETKNPEARIKALEEEKERHYRNAQAANKELAELRKFKEEKERESLTEIDKVKTDHSKASESLTAAEAKIRRLTIEKAFLAHNTVKWHNADQALSLADLSEVEVDEDGKVDVKALKAALTKLARENKHLVKSSQADDSDEGGDTSGDDNDGEEGKKGKDDQRSASTFGGKRKGEKEQPKTREELAKRFPVLQQAR